MIRIFDAQLACFFYEGNVIHDNYVPRLFDTSKQDSLMTYNEYHYNQYQYTLELLSNQTQDTFIDQNLIDITFLMISYHLDRLNLKTENDKDSDNVRIYLLKSEFNQVIVTDAFSQYEAYKKFYELNKKYYIYTKGCTNFTNMQVLRSD